RRTKALQTQLQPRRRRAGHQPARHRRITAGGRAKSRFPRLTATIGTRSTERRRRRKRSGDAAACGALSVIPWSLLDTAQMPGEGGELRLLRRGNEFSIRLGHYELMNSRRGGSEEALATLACEKIRSRERPRMLIGGLGMGFTLRAALAALAADASIVVAELVPAVVGWARGPMG